MSEYDFFISLKIWHVGSHNMFKNMFKVFSVVGGVTCDLLPCLAEQEGGCAQ
jgi:hypothetical protein